MKAGLKNSNFLLHKLLKFVWKYWVQKDVQQSLYNHVRSADDGTMVQVTHIYNSQKNKDIKNKIKKNEDREKKTIKCTDIRLTDRGFLARYQVGIWRAGFVGQSSRRDVCLGPGVATDRATTGRIWRLGSTTSSDWQLTWGWCAWDDQG